MDAKEVVDEMPLLLRKRYCVAAPRSGHIRSGRAFISRSGAAPSCVLLCPALALRREAIGNTGAWDKARDTVSVLFERCKISASSGP